jgi:glyoxylase-like metal-dependent hydrolase (beta-lactamase superfamily II)
VSGGGAIYLLQSEKTCLIDGGDRKGANRIINACTELNVFPDIAIITHPHSDHCQAIPALRKHAAKIGKNLDLMASVEAIHLLGDQSWSEPNCINIQDVTPLEEGDIIGLDGITLEIFDTPGHCKGHISILDRKNRNIFVGDAIGNKVGDNAFIPSFFMPFWDPDAFYNTIDKLKQIDYDTLCLAHFGYIYDDEAKDILDESIETYERWWQLFERNVNKLDDIGYMKDVVIKEMNLVPEDHSIISLKLMFLFALLTGWKKLIGKEPLTVGELLFGNILGSLITAFRTYKTQTH